MKRKTFVGKSTLTSIASNNIPKLWDEFLPCVEKITNNSNTGYYEIHQFDKDFKMEDFTVDMMFEKWVTVEVSKVGRMPKELKSFTIEGGKYAVFEHKGVMNAIQMSFDYAYGTWLQSSEYEIDKRADFERYGDQYLGPNHPESITELWIPIK